MPVVALNTSSPVLSGILHLIPFAADGSVMSDAAIAAGKMLD